LSPPGDCLHFPKRKQPVQARKTSPKAGKIIAGRLIGWCTGRTTSLENFRPFAKSFVKSEAPEVIMKMSGPTSALNFQQPGGD
jgi:hypothetical protein